MSMKVDRDRSFRAPLAWKFFLLLALIIPSMLAVSWVGGRGMETMKARLDALYEDNLASLQAVSRLSLTLEEADEMSLRLVGEVDPAALESVRSELREEVFPTVEQGLDAVRSISEAPEERALVDHLSASWEAFRVFTDSPEFLAASSGRYAQDRFISSKTETLARSFRSEIDRIEVQENSQAERGRRVAERAYARGVVLLRVIVALGLLVGTGATVWLIRAVVTRVREYSGFATQVAAGELNTRTRPRGHDELTDLGWALNEMVARGETSRGYEETQAEFTDAILLTEGEEEAHELLKRHLERSIPVNTVVMLNRNNSADRLEATTEIVAGSDLAERLSAAQPRDCLAVRLARPHHEAPGDQPLISCRLCGHGPAMTTCWPLLVSGEVTGSVLMDHDRELDDDHRVRVKDSVAQAAPVLANLRNLAIAELRAATDSLTGLPNARAVQDTLKRVVAQASRMVWPLSAVLLDLDHFKEVNDTFGHARGDEVLAAVGVALGSVVRESDFVGRYGGEEFIILLPDTGRDAAVGVCERLRTAFAEIRVLEGDRSVTASFGVAVFPEDAPDATRLVRNADRALYRAKANGRNRVEVFSLDLSSDGEPRDRATPDPAHDPVAS
jgi:diguanylate cyclase (GGDEF)-like protein